MTTKGLIYVINAAIVDVEAKRLFVQRRSAQTTHPWHYCMPGGKQEAGEDAFATLRRELHEEHAVMVAEGARAAMQLLYERDVTSLRTGRPMRVQCFKLASHFVTGPYVAGPAVAGFDWVDANELETLMLTPADHANRDKLLALIR